jgi:hypothetical protein
LNFSSALPGGRNGATASYNMTFKIYEPTSFVFLQDLAKASANINKQSGKIKNTSNQPNALQQLYILGIKFYGYDANGNLVNQDQQNALGSTNANGGSDISILERLFAIQINNIKFKLDGRLTTYNVEASVFSQRVASSAIHNTLTNSITITAGTVGAALQSTGNAGSRSLIDILNQQGTTQKNQKNVSIPTQ